MALTIQIEKGKTSHSAEATIIKLAGSLDTATAPELDRELMKVLAGRIQELVFDLGQLTFVSSAGLRLFSNARKQMTMRGSSATFVNMQPQVAEVFAIIQALPGISVFKDLEALDRYLAQRKGSGPENPWPGTGSRGAGPTPSQQ
ncbi:MAG: STAS domain-containing protein [Verrucomicrobiota bacterium]